MSRPRDYWHGIVKRMIMRYPQLKDEKTIQSGIFVKAIEKTNDEVSHLANGDDRLNAVQKVCFDKVLTVEGAAMNMHYSEVTVRRWINDYTRRVGRNAGF